MLGSLILLVVFIMFVCWIPIIIAALLFIHVFIFVDCFYAVYYIVFCDQCYYIYDACTLVLVSAFYAMEFVFDLRVIDAELCE